MTISIAKELKPFSHEPGISLPLPLTPLIVKAYPTRLIFLNLDNGEEMEESLDWEGPIQGFTAELDLYHSCIKVFGQSANGFKRVCLEAVDQGVKLTFDKEKKEKVISISYEKVLKKGERLSLGKHTKLDWARIKAKKKIHEMLPVFFALSQQMPLREGVAPVLDLLQFPSCHDAPNQLLLFLEAGFKDMLVPRLIDDTYQGIVKEGNISGSPFALFHAGYQAVRPLFFEETGDTWKFLPSLPKDFPAGRMGHICTLTQDEIAIEWVKKQIRTVTIYPKGSRSVELIFPKEIKSFRKDRLKRYLVNSKMVLEAGKKVVLDRFEK
ncbi:hypothetical protein [Rhabdochlamydiaceae symbiont of Dictyostelium giganteum]|uniref:hypothetical protein n=1 Tax=Rhabdochlamydiaceae symbiont of Dictyostelium giganteum TaxID=3342349 RepID=UPI00385153B8